MKRRRKLPALDADAKTLESQRAIHSDCLTFEFPKHSEALRDRRFDARRTVISRHLKDHLPDAETGEPFLPVTASSGPM